MYGDQQAYATISKWITGVDMISQQNCLALNFGSYQELPIPQIVVSLTNMNNSLDYYDFKKYRQCYFIFVAFKYLEDIKDAVKIGEKLMNSKPNVIFLMEKLNVALLSEIDSHLYEHIIVSIMSISVRLHMYISNNIIIVLDALTSLQHWHLMNRKQDPKNVYRCE